MGKRKTETETETERVGEEMSVGFITFTQCGRKKKTNSIAFVLATCIKSCGSFTSI
jgi:hypothetical protein